MYHCGMRQMEEKHVANQVDLMVWSNRLDLLALSNYKGEVQVHRLRWQKVWNLGPPKEGDIVKAMAWRPDGKALAVAYSSGCVCIIDIEDKEIIHKFYLDNGSSEEFEDQNPHEITCISWPALAVAYSSGCVCIIDIEDKEIIHKFYLDNGSSEEFEDQNPHEITCISWPVRAGLLDTAEYNIYDDASVFLPKLQTLNSYKNQTPEDSGKDYIELQEQTQLNILLVGYGTGYIHMSIFGRFPFGTINLSQVVNDECGEFQVLDVNFSDDFSVMLVLYSDKPSNNLHVAVLNTSVLSAYASDIFTVANKHNQIAYLLSHLDQTMTSINEAWEHILMEMDMKMLNYAASVPEGGVSADFLELLMMGTPSDELELFLLQELTAKGLKKFGSSVELSYSTIQKLVLKQLNIVGQSLTYYLAELRGLTRIPDRYKVMGLEESTVTEAIRSSFAFLNKGLELQQVIDVSMRNYKAFFRWLFVVIVRLLDEQTPTEIVKITQQELTHIADFLYNFYNMASDEVENNPGKPVRFSLERLGQYLQNQYLTILPDDEDNPWLKFLSENPCFVKDSDTLFSISDFKKFSLVQQQQYLKKSVEKVFDVTDKDMCKQFSLLHSWKCYDDKVGTHTIDNFRVAQIFDPSQQQFMLALMNLNNRKDGLCFMSVNLKEKDCTATAVKYYFSPCLVSSNNEEFTDLQQVPLSDLQFYSTEYLSVLLDHPSNEDSSIFVQLPLKIALDNASSFNIKSKSCIFNDKISRRDISPLLDQGVYKVLEKMDGYRIAVSGGRKVSVVLAKSRRKVRVFEMEINGENDEDDTLDSTPQSHNTTQRSDNSQNTPEKPSK